MSGSNPRPDPGQLASVLRAALHSAKAAHSDEAKCAVTESKPLELRKAAFSAIMETVRDSLVLASHPLASDEAQLRRVVATFLRGQKPVAKDDAAFWKALMLSVDTGGYC